MNTYGYVLGNPINNIDPTGKITLAEGLAGVGGILLARGILTAGAIITGGMLADQVDNDKTNTDDNGSADEGKSCAAQDLPDQTGNSKDALEKELEEKGFTKKTRGSYDEWTAPDGSKIFVRPNGEIIRQGPKRPNPENPNNAPGIRDRFDQNGNKIPYTPGGNTHSTGEIIK